MTIGKFNAYKGFVGTIEMTDGIYHGRLQGGNYGNFVNYSADSFEELEKEYHKAVDEYLIFRKEMYGR